MSDLQKTEQVITDTFTTLDEKSGEVADKIVSDNINAEGSTSEEYVNSNPEADVDYSGEIEASTEEVAPAPAPAPENVKAKTPTDSEDVISEFEKLIASNGRYGHLRCGRHLNNLTVDNYQEKLKAFYTEFVCYGINSMEDKNVLDFLEKLV